MATADTSAGIGKRSMRSRTSSRRWRSDSVGRNNSIEKCSGSPAANSSAQQSLHTKLPGVQPVQYAFDQAAEHGFENLPIHGRRLESPRCFQGFCRPLWQQQLGHGPQRLVEPEQQFVSESRGQIGPRQLQQLADAANIEFAQELHRVEAQPQRFDRQQPQRLDMPAGRDDRSAECGMWSAE